MATIKADDYNRARAILVQAGSNSASKSHPKHGVDTCPADHGVQLLREARDEFRGTDARQPNLQSGMTQAHYNAIHAAAAAMGIANW